MIKYWDLLERSSTEEIEEESQVESLLKQLDEKESSCEQTLLKLDHYQKTSEELSTLLKNSDFKKEFYVNECQEANIRVNELESKIKEMENQLSEYEITKKQLSHVSSELMSTQGQLLIKEAEIAELKHAKVESMIQIEAMESTLSQEKLKMEEILKHVSELNENIMHLKRKALEVEKEKDEAVSEKEAELEIAANKVAEAQKRLEIMHDLENQLPEKSAFIDSLQLELEQANELRICSEKVASDATFELAQLKADVELQGRKYLDQAAYSSLLETELEKLKMELGKSEEEVCHQKTNAENMKSDLEKIRAEAVESRDKENEAQVEIALLKFDLQNERLKLAATEVSEARSKSETSALHNELQQLSLELDEAKKDNQALENAKKLAGDSKRDNILEPPEAGSKSETSAPHNKLQQLSLELEEAKKENQELKKAKKLADESKRDNILEPPEENRTQSMELSKADEEQKIYEERKDGTGVHETLIEKNAPLHENVLESEGLKQELEVALSKIGEFRIRAEQATSRAEVAEKAKEALVEEIKRRTERKERRKAAISARHKDPSSEDTSTTNGFKHDDAIKKDHSLGRVLNIKF
ncbi:unnamed protein product [Fraxinus pennsylvanica]|uniref:Uncharacterized protein n=1 Tax=Fraxinus pennsylvanica TaxID=56036 RepID=A0AAD1YQ50_9LAMI|nr:unnamed protein product [Fraxinus pennsylvanica]